MRYYDIFEMAAMPKLPKPAPGFVRLYRGDSSTIDQFEVARTDLRALFGQGIYLTDNKRVAGDYVSKGPTNDVIFTLNGARTKQDVLSYYLRQLARKIDHNGVDHSHEIAYWSKDVPYSDGGDFAVVLNDLRTKERAMRMQYAMDRWKAMSKDYEIRIKLDGTGVIQRKMAKNNGTISVFDVPKAYVDRALHADAEAPESVVDELIYVVRRSGDVATANDMRSFIRQQEWEGETVSFRVLFTGLTADSPIRHDPKVQKQFIDSLEYLGYTGIEYMGGVTMGGGYKHRAFVFWDQEEINTYRVV